MSGKPPTSMTCIEIAEFGGPEVLKPATRPTPEVAAGEVLVRVAAAGVNRPDIFQRRGLYPPPPDVTDIPGLEVAGVAAAVADGVAGWKAGDPLCALAGGGGYAEYCAVPAPQCLPIPGGLNMVEAAAIPETFFTVWTNVFERAALKPGETLLVHGGAGGIGTAAIQMASRLGARVIVTAGTPEKCASCMELGAERAVNYRQEDFVAAAKEFGNGKGVDVILDMVGGGYIERNIKALAADGRLVNIAYLRGSKAEIDFLPVMLKRLTITGSTLRPQTVERKGTIAGALKERIWPLIASGGIKPVVHATFPLAEAAEAHRLMESGNHIGKIVLVV
ncbi:MAG: NAD(P)H-quinone oxidoreductase [Rhodospirillales bacterium]|jgi:putative PIG3 family NAD(P)H quinone oxidoreductase|nr:NAD(P)H-quinone oxidoreductase [Rhodospirillales bacterium]HIJ43719.1 NAD(P)H-quinone oxidoreductase [Rhodospirillaceae bacterium]MDP7098451.1 NAD(P)H-quinone oxidoreductase [Rhodospirillales bacterium]MDP7214869.1 NAD(P)H-quinone oxidoreductase [Rhodospirillales bacterium]HIJ45185.1 NAD(P)H-quinone oxidoreductase [Rhodospirillaceae bacterium]